MLASVTQHTEIQNNWDMNMKNLPFVLAIGFLIIANNLKSQDPISPSGPGYYKILSDTSDSIIIPFTFHDGKPLMQVEINGIKGTMLIDNGILWDQIWLFGSHLVTELNLQPIDKSSIEGAGEGDPTAAYTSENLTLKFDNIIFYDQPVLVSPPAAGFASMFPGADGQLCNAFFKHFIVEFDFINNNVILHKPDKFEYSGKGCVLDMLLNQSGTHSIPFSFEMLDGKKYDDRVDIDFGGIYPVKLALNNKHNIQLPENVSETYSYGAQGKNTEYSGKIKSMTIGKYTFQSPVAIFGDEKTSRVHPDNLGVIGLPLFMKFKIIFDYINNHIYIEPNDTFEMPFE
jgi:hypothetical protein